MDEVNTAVVVAQTHMSQRDLFDEASGFTQLDNVALSDLVLQQQEEAATKPPE